MNVLCAGLSHHIADVALRERFAVPANQMEARHAELRDVPGLKEAVIVSTCNRVEYYVATETPAATLSGLDALFRKYSGVADAPLYRHANRQTARHLFRVACGLDSMVVGETEILGQIKSAYETAHKYEATARSLNRLFQTAFRVAKGVRSQTRITRGPVSVGAVAVELAGRIFGDLREKKIMILGAGETSERTARSLQSRGVKSVIVSNRSFEKAVRLADDIGGQAIQFSHWEGAFQEVDILVSSTSAPHPLLTVSKMQPLVDKRGGRPLFVIDLAVPRDADPAINQLPGVFLYDIDSLQKTATESLRLRHGEVDKCESMIEGEVTGFWDWLQQSPSRREPVVLYS